MDSTKRKIIISLLEGLAYLVLCIVSVLILRGVFGQFLSEDSTFMIYDSKITEYPTITICTPKSMLEYGVDMNITIQLYDWEYAIVKGENTLDIGFEENIRLEPTMLEQFYSFVISGHCFKITRYMSQEIKKIIDGYMYITLYFNKSIPYSNLPDLEFYLTSEKNSLGAIYYEWMDGEELLVKIPKVST